MDFWTLVTSYLCGLVASNKETCNATYSPAAQHINNQVKIEPIIRETNSYLPLAVQIVGNIVDQTLNSELKQIVFDSFISKELISSRPTTLDPVTETEAPTIIPSVEADDSGSTVPPMSESLSSSVESGASTQPNGSESFQLLRDNYESQLKQIMVSELFDLQREPIREGLLFKSDVTGGTVSNELDSLPGSKNDPNYWQPDVNRLLDSIKVAEMFRQISPELLWLGELRDHLISEAIHKRLRNTSGLSSEVMQFLYRIDNANARNQVMRILKKILETKDISEEKTVDLANRIIGLIRSPSSKLSKIIAKCSSIRYS